MTIPLDFSERYKVEDRGYETPCWIWQGAKWKNGYGVIHVLGTSKADGTSRNEGAHRYAYQLRYGPIPRGQRVLHKCDQPDCVNWNHLYAGTQKQNIKDAIDRGRFNPGFREGVSHNVGESNPQVKLNPAKVAEIREMRARGVPERTVAKRYDISRSQVGRIYRGERWKVEALSFAAKLVS